MAVKVKVERSYDAKANSLTKTLIADSLMCIVYYTWYPVNVLKPAFNWIRAQLNFHLGSVNSLLEKYILWSWLFSSWSISAEVD